MTKIMFISSTGGHFVELMQLQSLYREYDSMLITEKTKNALELKEKYGKRISFLVFGSKEHWVTYPFRLLINCVKSLYFYLRFQPDVIVTTGAHTAGPMCCIGKLLGSKIIYIESFANIHTKTITGKLIYRFADCFVVQWQSMITLYPKAIYGGWIF